jgi:acyl-CoA thioester hydrolase
MKIDIPEKKKLVHEMVFTVLWGDLDIMGHVNHKVYFRYLESTRMEWLESLGLGSDPKVPGPVLVNAFCNFYRQLHFPDEVRLRLYISNPGRTSVESWGLISRTSEPDVVCAAGGGTFVWADLVEGKAVPLPEWMRQLAES